ncbi:MAG: Unknown protein [uncultured Sulfurovum sp.]|uniref:Peptidoglycan binding-like domain-containing protein n=1 Tax=uncultured Sulfurovum sp. TaxID=269237 RepID=A0A6S6TT21_9BACT|nr:MAG: Unknown protein [uncultured Sulfurovum sp.]
MKTLQLLTITAVLTTLSMSSLSAQEKSHERVNDNKRIIVNQNDHKDTKKAPKTKDHKSPKKEVKRADKKVKHNASTSHRTDKRPNKAVKHADKKPKKVTSRSHRIDKRPNAVKHTKMLKRGDRGLAVKKLQRALKKERLYRGRIDGMFGKNVKRAVKKFQRQHRLKADGIAGARTLRLLHIK